ncbi:LytTR family DNA-binding domain-containing protein [Rubrivirga sp. S365]|uniref:LytTR family DNA-binding domain-containing protein n=1 Tax=Rubrivirga litoralis TaxID=3075598 RepID=A0ABU3BSZ0_9BACT|nr:MULTISPECIES: LytTR family DNA-binding domain-containing protein [unclassified Rubrivirga]MDT0632412.1 LytTR family DNA-binding domain-containing protein [Rubrivirga sp. F394]MDT7855217.1 LytTR family DNA-binding domain-containing protein [Rubrivirga sp. S365]
MTRAMIADDEAPARKMVREALAALDAPVAVVGECANGPETVAALADAEAGGAAVGLLFLDVQMPGLTGFEVLDEAERRGLQLPRVVFSTAYDQHAVRAFEVAAVDYLLKPFTRARFAEAVGRALAQADGGGAAAAARHAAPPYAERLLVEDGGVFVPVATADLVWAEAAGDYTKLHTRADSAQTDPARTVPNRAGRTYLASQGIGALAERLDPARFARVHRSAVVALDALRALERDNSGGFVARLDGGAVVRVSRTYADTIRRMMA